METKMPPAEFSLPPGPLPLEARPCVDHIVTEDDTPVDNYYSERQMRLLTEPLYSSWSENREFIAAANVGLFYSVVEPPVVPDVFLSLGVQLHPDIWKKSHRSYFFWEFGKPPEAALEVVSNKEGGEDSIKKQKYAHMGILYYVIWDPAQHLSKERLQILVLRDKDYVPLGGTWLPVVGLGLTTWTGKYEGMDKEWLRWCDRQGNVIPTGAERAEQEGKRAEQEVKRAEQERERAERLATQLRSLGVKPENNS